MRFWVGPTRVEHHSCLGRTREGQKAGYELGKMLINGSLSGSIRAP